MTDLSEILLTAYVPALMTATGLPVYTDVPAQVDYPYIYLEGFYQKETGPKTSDHYEIDSLIQVVYRSEGDKLPLLRTKAEIMAMLNHGAPFTLSAPWKIQSCELISNSDTNVLQDPGSLNIGLIRLNFLITT